MMKRAQDKGLVTLRVHNLRDWARDKHQITDDAPYGGGQGMVMKPEPIFAAVEDLKAKAEAGAETRGRSVDRTGDEGSRRKPDHPVITASTANSSFARDFHAPRLPGVSRVILMSPAGRPFRQEDAARYAALSAVEADADTHAAADARRESGAHLILLCGHYEGVDQRVIDHLVDDEISIGDYVLTNGAIAAVVFVDAVVRLIPGVLGDACSAAEDSFASGLLEFPQYTRPVEFRGWRVPDILLSGNHAAIARWRREQALEKTARVRPDLLRKH